MGTISPVDGVEESRWHCCEVSTPNVSARRRQQCGGRAQATSGWADATCAAVWPAPWTQMPRGCCTGDGRGTGSALPALELGQYPGHRCTWGLGFRVYPKP